MNSADAGGNAREPRRLSKPVPSTPRPSLRRRGAHPTPPRGSAPGIAQGPVVNSHSYSNASGGPPETAGSGTRIRAR